MNLEDLTPEQKEKYMACSSAEELVALAKAEGHLLSDDELDAVAGGSWNHWNDCTEVNIHYTGGSCPGVTH